MWLNLCSTVKSTDGGWLYMLPLILLKMSCAGLFVFSSFSTEPFFLPLELPICMFAFQMNLFKYLLWVFINHQYLLSCFQLRDMLAAPVSQLLWMTFTLKQP